MIKDSNVTILVNSCDLYEDAWFPFFKLLKIHWPECEKYDIVINTEEKVYDCDFLNVRTFSGGKTSTWSKRLIDCLNTIHTEYVLFFLEDEFILKRINESEFQNMIDYLDKNPDVGVIYPHKNKKQTFPIEDKYFSRDLITKNKRLVCICAVWRKSYLLKILCETENPWEFECNAPERSKQFPERILQYNNSLPDLITYDDQVDLGYGITDKKWLPKTKELFEQYGITVNYSNLGFYPYENQAIAAQAVEKEKRKSFFRLIITDPMSFAHELKKRIRRTIGKKS